MKNIFKNPWAKAGEYYPEDVLNVSNALESSYSNTNEYKVNSLLEKESISKAKCTNALGTKNLSEVKSIRLEYEIESAGGKWNTVRKKFIARDKLIDDLLKMSGLPQADIDTLTLLKTGKSGTVTGLWDYMRSNVYNPNFNYKIYIVNDFLDYHRNYEAAIEDENTELNKLTHSRYKFLKATSQGTGEFQYSYKEFVNIIILIKEELIEKNRFDSFFQGVQVAKALEAMKDITFYPSELKAIVYQESSDLTNTDLDGISNEKIGLRAALGKNSLVAGIAQISKYVVDEGKDWASKNGIQFVNKAEKDLRKDPENAIILAACILASNYELYLTKAYKYDGKDCINWKKCIIASYNRSGPIMRDMIKNHNTINWDVLSNKPDMPKETKEYIPLVLSRL